MKINFFRPKHTGSAKQKPGKSWSVLRWVIFAAALALFLYSSANIIRYYYESFTDKKLSDDLLQIYQDASPSGDSAGPNSASPDSSSGSGSSSASFVSSPSSSAAPSLASLGLEKLKQLNSDTVGWISLPGTSINYPVLQGPDNEYYLKRSFYKNPTNHGSIYLDYRCSMSQYSLNTVIYGHNMKDGQMFASLTNYTKTDYYQKAPFITLDDGSQKTTWVIFAMLYANVQQDQGPIFYYNTPSFGSAAQYERFISQVRVRSVLNTGVDVNRNDLLLTLSTCAYNFDDARFAVIARKLRPGEEAVIDQGKVSVNPTPLYPDIWYEKNGGEKPDENALITALQNP